MNWTSASFFTKAQFYWARATARGKSSEDFLLNVSFVIEFVTRGALCSVNPALNASADIESLLHASGQAATKTPKSIDMIEAIRRLRRLIPDLTDDDVSKVTTLLDARNAELHGPGSEISQLLADLIMPEVYSFIVKVSKFSNESLETLLGAEDAKLANSIATAKLKDRSERVRSLIRVCKDRFFSLSASEQLKRRSEAETTLVSAVLTSGHHVKYLKCPACASIGRLLASPIGKSSPFLSGTDLVQEVRISPFKFVCKACELEIAGLDELIAAKFSHEYRSIDNVDPLEHFNIDPRDHVDHEEIAREFHQENYDYRDE